MFINTQAFGKGSGLPVFRSGRAAVGCKPQRRFALDLNGGVYECDRAFLGILVEGNSTSMELPGHVHFNISGRSTGYDGLPKAPVSAAAMLLKLALPAMRALPL